MVVSKRESPFLGGLFSGGELLVSIVSGRVKKMNCAWTEPREPAEPLKHSRVAFTHGMLDLMALEKAKAGSGCLKSWQKHVRQRSGW